MAILTVDLPPGMLKNGTPYSRRGRWTDGNLVRWHDGAIRPIGGWGRRTSSGAEIASLTVDPTLEAVRDIFAWRDLNQNQNVVFGSNLGLYHMNAGGVVTDITYAGFTPNNPDKDAIILTGYGAGPYGLGTYGADNNLGGSQPVPPDRWYSDNFGEVLLTGVRNNGGVYELDLGTLTLSAVTNAPSEVQDIVVTDQRQVMAIGGDGEPRRVQLSEVEDRTQWAPAISNQVIDRTLPGTGRLLRCVNVLRSVLILGETDAHVTRYLGPPYVVGVDLAGENCGPICAESVVKTDRFAVWWGSRSFWLYDGTVQQLPCDVIDFLYNDYDEGQASKITAFVNSDFSEIWWLYQSKSTTTTEVDSYVCWDYRENHWSTGRLDRTAGLDKGVTVRPIKVSSAGFIFNHELSDVFPDGDVFVKSGTLELPGGEQNMAVRYLYPDSETTSDLTFEFTAKQFPTDTEYSYGPYAYNNPVSTRVLGRAVRFQANFQIAKSELGVVRLDVAPSGTGHR